MRWFLSAAFLVGLLLVGVTPSPSAADGCLVRDKAVFVNKAFAVPYAGYAANVVHNGVANYGYNVKVIEAIVSPDYYYSVGSYYREKVLADAIVGRILEAQKNGLIGGQPPTGSIAPTNPAPTKPSGDGSVKAGAYQEPKLLASVTKHCASCHSGGTAKGNFTILTDDGKLVDLDERMAEKTFRLVSTGIMPKGGNPVPDVDIPLYNEWANTISQVGKK